MQKLQKREIKCIFTLKPPFSFLAVKFPGTQIHPSSVRGSSQDSAVISAASSSVNSNGLECPPALQEQPQAVIPQGKF